MVAAEFQAFSFWPAQHDEDWACIMSLDWNAPHAKCRRFALAWKSDYLIDGQVRV